MPSLNDSLVDILKEAQKVVATPISGDGLEENTRQLEGQSAALEALKARVHGTPLEKIFAAYVGDLCGQEQKIRAILENTQSRLALARVICVHSIEDDVCRICGDKTLDI